MSCGFSSSACGKWVVQTQSQSHAEVASVTGLNTCPSLNPTDQQVSLKGAGVHMCIHGNHVSSFVISLSYLPGSSRCGEHPGCPASHAVLPRSSYLLICCQPGPNQQFHTFRCGSLWGMHTLAAWASNWTPSGSPQS